MFKKLTLFLFVLLSFFMLNTNVAYASCSNITDFSSISRLSNLTYTDNSFLPSKYLDGTYNNYALFYIRAKGGSTSNTSRFLYVFLYNDDFGIEPFYLEKNDSSDGTTGYMLRTVTQYSYSNLSSVYGKWYYAYVEDSPATITWSDVQNSTSYNYNCLQFLFDAEKCSVYNNFFLKFDYDLLEIVKLDGNKPSYTSSNYTTYVTYLFGTSNIYMDSSKTAKLYDDKSYDIYNDTPVSSSGSGSAGDVDYSSGGVFGWIADFFKTLIDKVSDIPSSIGKFFENLVSVVVAIPLTIIDLLSDLLQFLFVPDSEFFSDIKDEFMNNFEFAFQVIELAGDITPIFSNSSESIPQFDITIYGKKMIIVDFSMFAQYRNFIQGVIIAIAYYEFIIWLVRNTPSVIHGFGVIEK